MTLKCMYHAKECTVTLRKGIKLNDDHVFISRVVEGLMSTSSRLSSKPVTKLRYYVIKRSHDGFQNTLQWKAGVYFHPSFSVAVYSDTKPSLLLDLLGVRFARVNTYFEWFVIIN